MSNQTEPTGAEGVLLYYYFTPLASRQPEEQQWYQTTCSQLNLVGRVRIARDGVNATLGGDCKNLQKHASQVADRYNTPSIDFKLTKSAGRKNAQCATESKFTQLTVEIVKEVVTIGLDDLLDSDGDVTAAPITARHASPTEFHQLLQNAARTENGTSSTGTTKKKETVLVDCRNIYETRIGSFEAEGVTTLDPGTRVFSDLPAWFESNAHKLAGKRVLMCCTGGVRCERASAYLVSLGKCFEGTDDVVQLRGGIERYLEKYGQQGYFKGKNFVFDERGDVEGGGGGGGGSGSGASLVKQEGEEKDKNKSVDASVRGRCCVCATPWGEYGARARCSVCRMLVLLCDSCCCCSKEKEQRDLDAGAGGEATTKSHLALVCELCQQRTTLGADTTITNNNATLLARGQYISKPTRKARILCLHGFRQTAKNFQGRTSALRRQLKNVAEFVFIDAPHTLPDIYGSNNGSSSNGNGLAQGKEEQEEADDATPSSAPPPPLENNEPSSSSSPSSQPQNWEQKRLRRGWLLTPEQYTAPHSIPENDLLDHEQHHRQTAGLEESLATLDSVLDTQGPWDGVLGFSQGASIAGLLAQRECGQRKLKKERRFNFVICCSGYPSPSTEREEEGKLIDMPSLHVYGSTKQDKQISEPESKSLWEQFNPTQRVLLRHNGGHVIPSTRLATARMADFITWAIEEEGEGAIEE